MRKILAFALIMMTTASWAQQSSGRKYKDVFPTYGNFQRKGWIISPMFTYTLPPFKQASQRLFTQGDQIYDIEYNASGRIGIGIEAGRFYLIETSRVLHSVEFNIGVKTLRGIERFEATLDDSNRVDPFILRGDGDFNFTYATANVRMNFIKQLGDYTFLLNSFGINADYMFSGNTRYNDRGLPIRTALGEPFIFQANYRLGYGFRMTKNVIVVPSVETPIVTFAPWDDAKSTLYVFNSRYRPLIFRLSFMLLDKKSNRTCPPKGRGKRKNETLFGMNTGATPW